MTRLLIAVCVAGFVSGCAGSSSATREGAATKPASVNPSPGPQEQAAVLKLANELNVAVAAGDARGVRRLMYIPENDYDVSSMQLYLEKVAAGEFKGSDFGVLHALIDGEYATAIIRQRAAGAADGEITPVALFKPGIRWRILPFDLRKDHPEIGGKTADAAYARLLKRAGDWVRANTNAIDHTGGR